ncbi:MAG: hypothetical protein ACOYMF_05505 [Bacteroidales bacterium]
MVTLNDWFENKDYGIGLALLARNCANRNLIQGLSRKTNRAKLEYELKKLAAARGIVVAADDAPELMTPRFSESHSDQVIDLMNAEKAENKERKIINPDELPHWLRVRWHENNDYYKEIRALHEKLKLMEKATDQDRAPLTKKISELDDVIRSNWEAIDAWEPGQEQLPIKVINIDHKRINANRKFISTSLKTLPVMASEANKEILIAKLQKRVTELLSAGEKLEVDTLEKLKKTGIQC